MMTIKKIPLEDGVLTALRLPSATLDQVKRAAKANDLSRSEVIRRALAERISVADMLNPATKETQQ